MKKLRVFKIVALLVAMLILCEVYLRLAPIGRRLQIYSKVQFTPDSVLGFRYLPYAKGIMRFPAYIQPYSINKWGFAGKTFSQKKTPGVYRIAIIGSSNECGLFTNGPINYPFYLEKFLRQRGYNVEVINLSIDGPDMAMRNLKLAGGECLNYQPNLVLLLNEFPITEEVRTKYRSSYKGIEIKYAHPETLDSARLYVDEHIQKKQFQHYMIDYSYIYRYLIRANFKYEIPPLRFLLRNTYDSYVYWGKNLWWSETMDKRVYLSPIIYPKKQSLEILKTTISKIESSQAKLLLYSTYENGYSKKYRDLYKENGINYVALNVPFKEEYSFGEIDGHSSQKGHTALANAFANYLEYFFKKNREKISMLPRGAE